MNVPQVTSGICGILSFLFQWLPLKYFRIKRFIANNHCHGWKWQWLLWFLNNIYNKETSRSGVVTSTLRRRSFMKTFLIKMIHRLSFYKNFSALIKPLVLNMIINLPAYRFVNSTFCSWVLCGKFIHCNVIHFFNFLFHFNYSVYYMR